jgi:hypothetical protein
MIPEIKLKWHEYIEKGDPKDGVKEALAWKARFGNYIIKVYPLKLYDKKRSTWRFSIYLIDLKNIDLKNNFPWVQVQGDTFLTAERAKKGAKQTLERLMADKRRRKWWRLKRKLENKIKEKA